MSFFIHQTDPDGIRSTTGPFPTPGAALRCAGLDFVVSKEFERLSMENQNRVCLALARNNRTEEEALRSVGPSDYTYAQIFAYISKTYGIKVEIMDDREHKRAKKAFQVKASVLLIDRTENGLRRHIFRPG